jgi:hypothetical protein
MEGYQTAKAPTTPSGPEFLPSSWTYGSFHSNSKPIVLSTKKQKEEFSPGGDFLHRSLNARCFSGTKRVADEEYFRVLKSQKEFPTTTLRNAASCALLDKSHNGTTSHSKRGRN